MIVQAWTRQKSKKRACEESLSLSSRNREISLKVSRISSLPPPSPLPPHLSLRLQSLSIMSADLATGNTPSRQASASHTKGGLSLHMAPTYAPTMGTRLNPEQYRTRKVALITGESPLSRTRAAVERGKEGSCHAFVRSSISLIRFFYVTRYHWSRWFLPH